MLPVSAMSECVVVVVVVVVGCTLAEEGPTAVDSLLVETWGLKVVILDLSTVGSPRPYSSDVSVAAAAYSFCLKTAFSPQRRWIVLQPPIMLVTVASTR